MKRFWIALLVGLSFVGVAAAQSYGMEEGYGMGRGMMGGGYGMGPGMMRGGYGMGPGMMRDGAYGCYRHEDLKLTAAQQEKMEAIQKEMRAKQWRLMGEMHELGWGQGGMHRGGWSDETAERKNYDKMSALHKQMFENRLEARKRMEKVLTAGQRKLLQKCLDRY
jgi:Spy/CpxP family protein refolding chaperone